MTTMLDIDDFLPEALRYAPNTSEFVVQRAIVQAARDLCQRCNFWRESDRFEITAPAMQGIVTIADAEIVRIMNARLDGNQLEPKTAEWLDEHVPDWADPDAPTASARYVAQIEPGTVTVVPKATGSMDVRLVLKPSVGAQTLPAFLLRDYNDEIGRGAASKILTDPNSSNPQLGLDLRAWFESRLDKLALQALKGQHGARLRTKGAYF